MLQDHNNHQDARSVKAIATPDGYNEGQGSVN